MLVPPSGLIAAMTERPDERDVVAEAAATLEQAESSDDGARLAALEEAHAALERELDRPVTDQTD